METQLRAEYPIYYPMESRPFFIGSIQSGAEGATAKLSHSFSNNPHRVYGIRISNWYEFVTPVGQDALTQAQIAEWLAMRELDDEQEVKLELSQLSVFAQFVHQRQLCGSRGVHWHPFSAPYTVQGGNDFKIEVRRLVSYPTVVGGTTIKPYCSATLVCGLFAAGPLNDEPALRRRG